MLQEAHVYQLHETSNAAAQAVVTSVSLGNRPEGSRSAVDKPCRGFAATAGLTWRSTWSPAARAAVDPNLVEQPQNQRKTAEGQKLFVSQAIRANDMTPDPSLLCTSNCQASSQKLQ